MLKKAGIVVAAAAAGLLAVSPLAFAGDKGDDGHHGHQGHYSAEENRYSNEENENNFEGDSSEGLVNVADNNVAVPVAVCNNDIPVNVLGIQVSDVQADLVGALGLLGSAEAEREGQTGDSRGCEQNVEQGDATLQNIDD